MKDILQLPLGLYAILANIVRMGLHLFRNFHQHIINILTPHEEDSRFLTVNVRKLSMGDLMYIQVAHTLKFYNPMPGQSTVVIHELAEAVSPDSV